MTSRLTISAGALLLLAILGACGRPAAVDRCADVICEALDECHASGICDATSGICSNATKANGSPCEDGDKCTLADSCQSGVCVGTNAIICTASDQCHVAGMCDPTSGICSNPKQPDDTPCNDTNDCTEAD